MYVTLIAKAELFYWAKRSTKPKPSSMNRQFIYEMIEDMPNIEVRDEIREIMLHNFTYGIDETQLHLLSNEKAVYHTDQPGEIDKHLIKWLKEGQIYVNDNIEPLCYIPLFLKDEGTKTRLIPDFKHEINGWSLNKLVKEQYTSVQYPSVLDLLKFVYDDDRTVALGKNDGLSFFRQLNMAESNQHYAGYLHRGITFFDARMPWGTPRAPRVAHYLSLCLQFIANKYIPLDLRPCIFSYVDDRIIRGRTRMRCLYAHLIYLMVCERAGTPVKPSKTVLCSDLLVGLGVGFDLRGDKFVFVPEKKKVKYVKSLNEFLQAEIVTARQGQSVAGKTEHVSWLKWPFRVYNRILYNEIPKYEDEDQTFKITEPIRHAITQWIFALELTKPARMQFLIHPPTVFDFTVVTDGSDIGYGGYEGTSFFFDQFFPCEVNPNDTKNIRDRELYPIAIILKAMGWKYANSNVLIRCDNENAVNALVNKDIRNPRSHNLVIMICELAIEHSFWFHVDHIKGEENSLADALSRMEINKFKKLASESGRKLDSAPLLFERIPFDFGSGKIMTNFQELTYRN